MDVRRYRRRLVVLVGLAALARPASAHVDYVTDPAGDTIDAFVFLRETLTDPVNAAIFFGTGLLTVVGLALYLRYRPRVLDVEILRAKLVTYEDLIPWMLRLSLGLPLVGAGFQGYLFAPTVSFEAANPLVNQLLRLALIGVGFFILFGLGTRIVTTVGLGLYGLALTVSPDALLALEYVPGFVALFILGGGRPSADDILLDIASAEGTVYGRIDPVHHLKEWLDELTAPYRQYVPTILRIGLGASFVFLGVTQKLGDPARSLAVVEKYDLTAVVPVAPELWVLGAGVAETLVGLALIAGFLTRASAGVAFLLFTMTLFGLPDDPVLAHVTLFGMASALVTLGSGPFSVDRWFGSQPREDLDAVSTAD
jgi:uncharacterized membrane protein YphA (DoxX/SURF4 family)